MQVQVYNTCLFSVTIVNFHSIIFHTQYCFLPFLLYLFPVNFPVLAEKLKTVQEGEMEVVVREER